MLAGIRGFRLLPLVLAAIAPTQERQAWQVLRAVRIDGARTVTAAAIRSALASNHWTRRAIAAIDQKHAAEIATRLTDGLHGVGLVQAKVEVRLVDDDWHVRIVEGELHRCGEIVFAGTTPVASEVLAASLRAKADDWPGWQSGEPAPADSALRPAAAARVEQACREHGWHGVRADVAFGLTDGAVTLNVSVTQPGRLLRANRIAIAGDRSDADAATAAALIAWTPGRILTATVLDELRNCLLRTGRYAAVTVPLPADAPATLDPLVITVQPIDGAPASADPAARDLARIAAGLDSLRTRLLGGSHVHLALDLVEPLPFGWTQVLPGEVQVDFATDGLLLEASTRQPGDSARTPFRFAIDHQGLWLQYSGRRTQLLFGNDHGLQLEVRTTVGSDGMAEFRWGFGFSTVGRTNPRIEIDPRTAAAMLQRPTIQRQWHGDELHVALGATTVRLGPQGRLAEDAITIPSSPRATLRLVDHPVGASIAMARRAGADAVQVPFAVLLFETLADGVDPTIASTTPTNRALLAGLATAMQSADTTSAERVLPLRIRGAKADVPPGDPATLVFATLFCALAAGSEIDGWPTHLAGCAATFADGDRRGAMRSLLQLAERPTTGPIALWAIARASALLDNDELQNRLRSAARARWGLGTVLADLEPFLTPDSDLGRAARAIGAQWRQTPLLHELVGETEDDLAAFRLGVGHLWLQGPGDRLRDTLFPEIR